MKLAELAEQYNFTRRTVAITGGAGVLGGAIAGALVELGANVSVLDHRPERAGKVLERLNRGPGTVRVVYADVLKPETLVKAEEVIRLEFGPVDTLINAAGGIHPGATTSPDKSFFDLAPEDLRHVSDLNFMGTISPCQVFGRGMAQRGQGVILNVSSMSAYRPLTRVIAYSAAKAAVSSFTQWLAVHMAQEYSAHIRVNALAPGFFLTDLNRFLLLDQTTGELSARGQAIMAHTPMKRFGQPEDLIGAALWLLSPLSSFVTGIVLPVDGGFLAYAGV